MRIEYLCGTNPHLDAFLKPKHACSVKPEVPKSWTLEIPELCVLALTKGHVGSGNEIENLSDARSETCAVDCVFYISAFRSACKCTWQYRWNGLAMTLEEVKRFSCVWLLFYGRNFCRFANGDVKICRDINEILFQGDR